MAAKRKKNTPKKNPVPESEPTDSTPAEPLENTEEKGAPDRNPPKHGEADSSRRSRSQLQTPETTDAVNPTRTHKDYFSAVQKILVASIVVVVAMLVYILLKPPPKPVAASIETSTPQDKQPPAKQTTSSDPQTREAQDGSQKPAPASETDASSDDALSFDVAQKLYLLKDYDGASAAYDRLARELPDDARAEKELLTLKMALCAIGKRDIEYASALLEKASRSRCPIIRVTADYHRSFVGIQKEQYFNARTAAYRAAALIETLDLDEQTALSLKRDCCFLAAEATTRKVLALQNRDANLPPTLWTRSLGIDPFANLDQEQTRSLLSCVKEPLSEALLGPKVERIEGKDGARLWSVACAGASVEELLSRFAAEAGLDISWDLTGADNMPEAAQLARKRPLSLYLSTATPHQVVTTAAGCVGLIARPDSNGLIIISSPADFPLLSEQVSMISREAVSIWQRFLLAPHNDARVPNAHFALALLKERRNEIQESISEYKLLANSFTRSPLAPHALLNSAELRSRLRDYTGACRDLSYLIEQYSDADIADQAALSLADTTYKAGRITEAGLLYAKVYHIGASMRLKKHAAYGAAKCYYEIGNHDSAAKWLARYIPLVESPQNEQLCFAYLMLGNVYMADGRYDQASQAFDHALSGHLPKQEHMQALSALARTYIKQEKFIEALNAVEDKAKQFNAEEAVEILLLKARILRAMGLTDKAAAAIGDWAEYAGDTQQKARLTLELAYCSIDAGDLEKARNQLAETLAAIKPGPTANEVALKLADVSLELGRNSEAVSICRQLLNSVASGELQQEALKILAAAHCRQQEHEEATLVFLGQWK